MKLITLERLGTFWAAIKSYLSNNKYMKLVASATEPSDHSVCWINTNNGLIYIYNSNTASWCSRVSTCATADNANYATSSANSDYAKLADNFKAYSVFNVQSGSASGGGCFTLLGTNGYKNIYVANDGNRLLISLAWEKTFWFNFTDGSLQFPNGITLK